MTEEKKGVMDKLKDVVNMAKDSVYVSGEDEPEKKLDEHVKKKVEEKAIENKTDEIDDGELIRLKETNEEIEEEEALEEENTPMFKKELTLQEIALILGVEDVRGFVELFEEDLYRWDTQVKNLTNSRLVHAQHILGEFEQGDTLMQKAYQVAEVVSIENKLDFNNLDDTKKWRIQSKQQFQNATHIMEISKSYEKVMTDYLNVLNARHWAKQHYIDAQNQVIQTLQADNIKLSKLYAPLVRLTKDLDKVVDAYVQQPSED